MSREVMDILEKLGDKILFYPLDKESDDILVDGVRFSHQDLMSDIF